MAIDYAKTFQKYIDEELAAHSATEWMASTSGLVRYGEGKDVGIVNLTTKGRGHYDSTQTAWRWIAVSSLPWIAVRPRMRLSPTRQRR